MALRYAISLVGASCGRLAAVDRVLVFVVLVAVVAAVAWSLQRSKRAAPTQGSSWAVPTQVDRLDFDRPEVPWLVIVFSSASCLSCQGTWDKAQVLASD